MRIFFAAQGHVEECTLRSSLPLCDAQRVTRGTSPLRDRKGRGDAETDKGGERELL